MTTEFDALFKTMFEELAKEFLSKPKWISVETKMPDADVPVLLLLDKPTDGAGAPWPGMTHVVGWWDGGSWESILCEANYDTCSPVYITPTHWMPIPPLPTRVD